MAPSQMEPEMGSPEYTHKKFNCGYSHKKLGRRFVRRTSQEENQQDQDNSNCSIDIELSTQSPTSSVIFRPYAQEAAEETPKTTNFTIEETQQQMSPHYGSSMQCESKPMTAESPDLYGVYHYYAHHFSQLQSPNDYALKLQRQRAALYMKHVMQYYENGNGWPSMHPNAVNNGLTFNNGLNFNNRSAFNNGSSFNTAHYC